MPDTLSTNEIIGDIITREKYQFVDSKLIASVIRDVMDIIRDEKIKSV